MTLYEVNQQAYGNLPEMKDLEVKEARDKLVDYLMHMENICVTKYYMMLNHEKRYYTVFVYKKSQFYQRMADEILDVAQSLGPLKAIEIEDNMVEIWIGNGKNCHMYALFPYDQGVIEV